MLMVRRISLSALLALASLAGCKDDTPTCEPDSVEWGVSLVVGAGMGAISVVPLSPLPVLLAPPLVPVPPVLLLPSPPVLLLVGAGIGATPVEVSVGFGIGAISVVPSDSVGFGIGATAVVPPPLVPSVSPSSSPQPTKTGAPRRRRAKPRRSRLGRFMGPRVRGDRGRAEKKQSWKWALFMKSTFNIVK